MKLVLEIMNLILEDLPNMKIKIPKSILISNPNFMLNSIHKQTMRKKTHLLTNFKNKFNLQKYFPSFSQLEKLNLETE